MAKLARILKSLNYPEEKVRKYIRVAYRAYRRTCNLDFSQVTYPQFKSDYLETQAGLLLIDIEFYKLTREGKYQIDAQKRVQMILAAQNEKDLFYSDCQKTNLNPLHRDKFHQLALYEFVRANPESPFRGAILESFAKWAAFVKPFTELSPFRQVGGLDREGNPRNLPQGTCNASIASTAWAMATAAILLEKGKYLEIAERQIPWRSP